jgi:cytochrome o ubiquinol oxidase operon protein cyoD
MSHTKLLGAYVTGFVLSVLCTLAAYRIVDGKLFDSPTERAVVIFILALVQLGVQLLFFLHIDHEKRPRWNQMAFAFMGVVVIILVAGTIWIMANLDYHGAPDNPTDSQIIENEGIRRSTE